MRLKNSVILYHLDQIIDHEVVLYSFHGLGPNWTPAQSVGHGGIGDSARLGELAISHAEIFEGFFQGVREIYEGIEFRKRGNFSV